MKMRTVGAFFAIFLSITISSFGQTELIVNGGFENGTNGWALYGAGVTVWQNQPLAHSGVDFLHFGPAPSGITIAAVQNVSIPTNTIYARLTFWDDPYCPVANGGIFHVDIWDTNLATATVLTNLTGTLLSQSGQLGGTNVYSPNGDFDLTPFAGRTVAIVFWLDTRSASGSGSAYVGVDDVSLQIGTTADIPPNDHFTNRTSLIGTNITVSENNFFASVEPGEPFHAGNVGGHSLWWTWTAPTNGTLEVDTTSSEFFPLLAVYTGSGYSNLVKVASDNSLLDGSQFAQVKFVVFAGTSYQIAVDGYNNGTGTAQLNLHFAPDKTAPKVTISSPASNAKVFTNVVTFRGTASDSVGVSNVMYRLENVAGTNDYAPTDGTNVNQWSVLITNLVPGPNTIRVRAVDFSSNTSAPVARTIDYVVTATSFILETNGSGSISSIPKPPLLVGHTYTITAKPNPGNLFSNWTEDVFSSNPKLTFVMQTNMTIAVNFVTNVFLAVKGTYSGLFLPTTNDITTSNAGYFTATLTDKGALSAKLTLPIIKASVSAKINLDGSFSNNIARPGGTPVQFTGQVDLNGGDQITGQFSADGQTSDLLANRAVYSSKIPSPLAGAKYTSVIEPGPAGGYGSGTLAVDPSGNVKFSGVFGDNTKYSMNTKTIIPGGLPKGKYRFYIEVDISCYCFPSPPAPKYYYAEFLIGKP